MGSIRDEYIDFRAELKKVHLTSKSVDGTPFPLIQIQFEQFNPKDMNLLSKLGKHQLEKVRIVVIPDYDRQLTIDDVLGDMEQKDTEASESKEQEGEQQSLLLDEDEVEFRMDGIDEDKANLPDNRTQQRDSKGRFLPRNKKDEENKKDSNDKSSD